jgi:hypothetical protein
MPSKEFHTIWREQCEAAKSIRERYGAENALGYLVDEKLMNFAGAAEQRPEFAAELPAFVAEVRKLFTPQELRDHFAELERTPLFETEPEDEEEFEDDPLDNPAQEVEQRQRLAWVKAMLLQLGS